jgi:PAS domain S-box-containing protein
MPMTRTSKAALPGRKARSGKARVAVSKKPRRGGGRGAKRAARPRFESLLTDISMKFIALQPDRIDSEILRAQQQVCEFLGLDISSMWEMPPGDPHTVLATHIYAPPDYDVPLLDMDARDFFPWSMTLLTQGRTVVLSRMSDIPPEGARDLEIFRYYRIQSSICFPLSAGGGPMFGAVAFDTFRKPRTWTPGLISKLGLVAQVFGNAIFRKQVEAALRKSQDLLVETEKIGKVGGWEIDLDTLKQKWTAEIFAIHEVAPDYEPTAEKGIQFYTAASRPIIERCVREAIEQGKAFDVELEIVTAKGRLRSVHAIGKADLANRRIFGFFQDITERKRAETALAESEDRYRTLFDLTPAGIVVVDSVGKVLMANSTHARMYGYGSPQELIGFESPLFLAEQDRPQAFREMSALLEGSGRAERVYTAVRRDGSPFTVEVTFAVLWGQNREVQGYLCLTRDLTKTRQDEGERTQLRLERDHLARLLTVNEISTSLAHEINQPLGAILNNAEAARVLLSRTQEGRQAIPEIIDDIIRDAQRAGDVIRKVRSVVKKSDASFERLPVLPLIDETMEILRNNLALNDVSLRVELGPDVPDIRGDRVRLQQVLLNLVTNALDAMKEAPTRILAVGTAMAGPDTVTVSLGDSGPGIPEARQEAIFQPFITTKKDGLGLGLAICRSIVEEHGGRIWAENDPAGGARFSFTLKAWREGSA